MNWWTSIQLRFKGVLAGVLGLSGAAAQRAGGWGKLLRTIASGADYMLTHPVQDLTNALGIISGLLTGNGRAATNALGRLGAWNQRSVVPSIKAWVRLQLRLLFAQVLSLLARVDGQIIHAEQIAERYARQLVGVERRQRRRAIKVEHAQMLAHVRAALQTVQRQAVSGYKLGIHTQQPVIIRLADDIAARLPVVRELVGKIVAGAIDLAEIDDPLLRLVVSRALIDLIDHLGIEKPAGQLLQSLLGNLLGSGVPHDLTQVIADLGQRITSVEQDWSQFMIDGGPEILQAGEGWKSLTSLLTDAGLLTFFGMQVADPSGWATAISDTLGVLVADTMTAAADLIRSA